MIGVIIAMESEAEILLRDMEISACKTHCGKPVYEGKVHGRDIVLIVCGVGKVNAACGAQMAIDIYHARILVNFGVAGGIDETTEICGVYQVEKAVQYDFDLAGLNHTKIGTLNEFEENYIPLSFCPGLLPVRTLATADRFNDDKTDYLLIRDYMQADLRDMEGGSIAQVAVHAGTPFYVWKAVSDKAGNVSSFEQYNANKLRALENLHQELKKLFMMLPDDKE